ncbi:RagB/SusD family nutrient uptake outer membrane protein [Chitinophaga sancti]|uniref:RagB/SusD family nutrient uptake outer membrane protein n=1 Tax=Chitinophaga sancti TaxID=1004 RepID=UPI003F797B67
MKKLSYILLALGLSATSCKKFVTIDNAPNSLSPTDVYAADATATSAVVAMYTYYATTYSLQYYTWTAELLGDDVQYRYYSSTPGLAEYQNGNVTTTNNTLRYNQWYYPFYVVAQANSAIDGLTKSTTLTGSVKNQLLGESYFMRAFHFFYLNNFFGGVPLSLDPVALNNSALARSSKADVYAQIITDLKTAADLLPGTYTGTLHARVNKHAAEALLARVYLYQKDYANAVTYATKVIGATDVTYSLSDLATTFKNSSAETILQFATYYGYTSFGYRAAAATTIPDYYLYSNFMNQFETGDNRKTAWTDSLVSGGTTYRRVNKYKLGTATAGDEYYVILRLAEQYLIRAEANAQLNNISAAQADLDAVRNRAGLGNTTAATKDDLLTAIAQERKIELFGELGHRWFDLVRTGQADAVLSKVKSTWVPRDTLMPIPYQEILNNKNLTQNPGFE